MTGLGESAVVDDEPAPAMSNQESPVEASSTPRPKGFRRYLRFNLLTALLLFLLVSAYFGVRQRFVISAEETAAKKLLAKSGAALVEKSAAPVWLRDLLLMQGEDFRHVEEVRFPVDESFPPPWVQRKVETAGPNELEALAKLPRLRTIDFSTKTVDDEALSYLGRCASLQEVRWDNAVVNDAGIDLLAELRELRSLTLARTFTTDRSLETLAKLPNLESIVLDDSTTDRGIAALTRCPTLRHVDATATSFRGKEVRSLVERGIAVTLPARDWKTQRHAEEAEILSMEKLAALVRDPSVVSVDLPSVGFPYRFEELRELLAQRPADASYCRIHGHVLISADDLLREAQRSNQTLGYIPYNVSPESSRALQAAGIMILRDSAVRLEWFPHPGQLVVPVEPDA